MGNWSTLNKGITASTKDAVEIQVEILLETYQDTLKLQQKNQLNLAKQKYQELVAHTLVKKEPKPKKEVITNVDVVEESPLSTLRFLVFKNYACILKDEFLVDRTNTKVAEEALTLYLKAIKIDPTEFSIWYHIGFLARALKKLRFARLAFETGFYVNNDERALKIYVTQPQDALKIIKNGQFTPMQWKCLESLCGVLFEIGDYRSCQSYINIVMTHISNWEIGLKLQSRLQNHVITNNEAQIHMDEDVIMETINTPEKITIAVEKADWKILLDSLSKEYKSLMSNSAEEDKEETNADIISETLAHTNFINKSIHIVVEKEEEALENSEDREEFIDDLESIALTPVVEHSSTTEINNTAALPIVNGIIIDKIITNAATDAVIIDDVDVPARDNEESLIPQKRKRETDDETGADKENEQIADKENEDNKNDRNSENEEGDEAEEKRLSLRASKRQREKIANEETSRIKMLEEENEFANKIQAFYNNLNSISAGLYQVTPWQNTSNEETLSHFWEWFDMKISELDSTYCWDIDNASIANDSNAFGESGGKSLIMFVKGMASTVDTYPVNTTAVKHFIMDLNDNNIGIMDSLCKVIVTIIENDSIMQTGTPKVWSNEFLDMVTDTIAALEVNFVDSIFSDSLKSDINKTSAVLRICEYFTDRLIRATMTTVDDAAIHTSNHGRKRITTSLVKASKLKTIESLTILCKYWTDLLDRALFSSCMDSFLVNSRQINEQAVSVEEASTMLRCYTLRGKLALCDNDIENAYHCYWISKTILEQAQVNFNEEILMDVGSMFDPIISWETTNAKLALLKVGKIFVTAKQKLDSEDYNGVIEDLEPVVRPKLSAGDSSLSSESMQMINTLARAYVETNRNLDAWNCYMRMFCGLMKQLTVYGANYARPDEHCLSKNEDTEFLKLLALINNVTDQLVSLTLVKKSKDWLPSNFNKELIDNLVVLLRMSIYFLFRHPDYIPFVNNFTNPDIPPHTPSKLTKSNKFIDILTKAWVLQSHLLQHVFYNDKESFSKEVMVSWAAILQQLHDELGERKVCGAAKRLFLNHLLTTLTKADNIHFRNEIYQCYYCLFGVHLAAESEAIEEHSCTHTKLDQKASEPLFALVVDSAIEKLEAGSLLKTDLKDVIDTVSDSFVDLPAKNTPIKHNKNVIETYLDSKIELCTSFDVLLRMAIIPTVNIDSEKADISMVYYKIFWIRAKTLRLQIKNRAKINNEKTLKDLDLTIDEFTSHLILNPDDADAWYELGACFQQRADEELSWSASNIEVHRDVIGEYQRNAYHAFMRSIYLSSNTPKSNGLPKKELYIKFGDLLYSMSSSPMHMEAFKMHYIKSVLGKSGNLLQIKAQPPSAKSAYKLATIMYNHALKFKTQNKLDWRCYYMIGKCLGKIGRPPKEVLDWYFHAIKRSTTKRGRSNQILEPIYIFCSYLVKYLFESKIEPKDVEEFLSKEKQLYEIQPTENNAEEDVIFMGSSSDVMNTEKSSAVLEELQLQTAHLSPGFARAYNAVFKRLTEVRLMDNKNWQHRPLYRICWMHYHVYRNAEKTKSEFLKLFTLKATVKNHINIWKPTYEFPGKHFEYHDKYTRFLINVAKETNDTYMLKQLYRKLRRAQALMLKDKEIFQLAYTAYLEIIKEVLRFTHDAKKYMKMIKESKIDKGTFEVICSTAAKALTEDTSKCNSELYSLLQDLSELKRLTQGFIVNEDAEVDILDKVIRMTFATVVFGGDQGRQRDLETMTENAECSSKSRKDLRAVLLAQAKAFMSNIPSTSK